MIDDSGIYGPAETEALARALESWIADQGGRDAAINGLTARAYGNSRELTRDMLDTVERLLALASARDAGLVQATTFID